MERRSYSGSIARACSHRHPTAGSAGHITSHHITSHHDAGGPALYATGPAGGPALQMRKKQHQADQPGALPGDWALSPHTLRFSVPPLPLMVVAVGLPPLPPSSLTTPAASCGTHPYRGRQAGRRSVSSACVRAWCVELLLYGCCMAAYRAVRGSSFAGQLLSV